MSASHEQTLEFLQRKVQAKEAELIQLKELINGLSAEIGLPKPYLDVHSLNGADASSIRSDQFYGQPLSTAIRTYLEIRKASGLGAASLVEIFTAVRSGGFKFETKEEDNMRNSVRIALRKNSSVFHRLPNGEYGLLAWYPSAKEAKADTEDKE
jgi:hypothetical protein